MRNIWEEGFEIERDGQKITINPQEIRAISNLIDAWNGRDSIEYWLDCIDEDTDGTLVQAAEKAMEVAKVQLLREVGKHSDDSVLADMEREVLDKINALGIGAQGFGGDNTAFAVHIGKYPTHIAALPVAVNIQCNAMRIAKAVL